MDHYTYDVTVSDNARFTNQRGIVTGRLFAADMANFRRQFERVADAVTIDFTLSDWTPTRDHREDHRVTVTTTEEVVNAVSLNVVTAPLDEVPPPFHLTRAILQQLGSCGTYVRRFSNKFPSDQYPDGIVINEENCARWARDWDWDWACGRMLNDAGRNAVTSLVRSRSEANRQLGTGERRRAAAFGRIFSTRVDMRHPDMLTVRDRAAQLSDQEAINEVERVKRDVENRNADIRRYTRHIADLEEYNRRDVERLPALEEAAAGPLKRLAEQKHREAVQNMERMRERFEKTQEAVKLALAEVERLGALVGSTSESSES